MVPWLSFGDFGESERALSNSLMKENVPVVRSLDPVCGSAPLLCRMSGSATHPVAIAHMQVLGQP